MLRTALVLLFAVSLVSCAERQRSTREVLVSGEPAVDAAVERRIVQTAEVDLATEDLAQGEKALFALVETHAGYVSRSNVGGPAGSRRHGSWTVRVPVGRFRAFLDELVRLGEAVSVRTDSLDVTEEYVDVEARLSAKREEEKRMLRHLHDSTKDLPQILDVERELARVRTEAEQLEGQRRALAAKSDLATLVVTIEERVPFRAPVEPGLVAKLGGAFGGSLRVMRQLGEALAIVAAAVAPWLLLASPFALAGHIAVRRVLRKRP